MHSALCEPRLPRRVPDVQNAYTVGEYTVEDFVRKADQRNDVYAGSFVNDRCNVRMLGDLSDDLTDSSLKGHRHCVTVAAAVGGYFVKIGNRPVGEFDLHARRNAANAAATAASLATPLCSASSIACSSSGVAR